MSRGNFVSVDVDHDDADSDSGGNHDGLEVLTVNGVVGDNDC